ncbi:MAG: hypothetical protein M3Q99_20395 [Acidobacteriota bacterium]|nr:hypothetical protein [Acidobacteriota bacterium]
MISKSAAESLADEFLQVAKQFQANIEPIKVLKSRTYKIAEANVLVRAATEGKTGKYFFGLNYLTAEEMNNLDNPFIAFVCGSIEQIIIIPAKVLFQALPNISHDRNGEYKINIDQNLTIALSGRGNRFDCTEFINAWELLLKPYKYSATQNTVEESLHSVIQGRLIEIGNIRGFHTFCPDKSKKFNDVELGEISTLTKCPELQFSNYDLLRKIDVIWFREKGKHLIPENAFEVEMSTGTWSGVGRLSTLIDYNNVGLYIISDTPKRFGQVIDTLDFHNRYKHIKSENIGDLYSAEKNLKDLRYSVGL